MKLTKEAKTGITAVIIIAMTIWGYNFLKGKNIFKPSQEYYVVYDNSDGIIKSGNVLYRGFKVGNINGIKFIAPDKFIVKFVLEQKIQIPVGSTVIPKQPNPIATAKDLYIEFSDNDEFCSPGDTLLPGYDAGFMAVLDPIQNEVTQTLKRLNETIEIIQNTFSEDTQADLQATISSIRRSVNSVSVMLASGGSIDKTMKNLNSITASVKTKNDEIIASIEHFANIAASIDSANLQQTLLELDSTVASTSEIIAKINNSEGSMGLLVNDSALYLNLAMATASLDSLLSDLKEHPKRYVHFSLLGKKE